MVHILYLWAVSPFQQCISTGFSRGIPHTHFSPKSLQDLWLRFSMLSMCPMKQHTSIFQGHGAGWSVSLENEPMRAFVPRPRLKDWADQPCTQAWVAKREIRFLQIIQIISFKPLLDKNTTPHEGDILTGIQSCSGCGLAPVVCTELLDRVDQRRST